MRNKTIILCIVTCLMTLIIFACSPSLPVSGQRDIAGLTMLVDAGHGDSDVGAIGVTTGRYEKDVNLEISRKLKAALEQRNVIVIMTRESDEPLGPAAEQDVSMRKENDMQRREEIIENANANLLISIHQNSFEDPAVAGPQMFYLKHGDTNEEAYVEFAQTMQSVVNSALNVPSPRNISFGNWRLLKKGNQPGVLVECGFFTNPEEEVLLQTEAYQDALVDALVQGIEAYVQKYGA